MSEVNFKVGDIVSIKSGGPSMTISSLIMVELNLHTGIWKRKDLIMSHSNPDTLKLVDS